MGDTVSDLKMRLLQAIAGGTIAEADKLIGAADLVSLEYCLERLEGETRRPDLPTILEEIRWKIQIRRFNELISEIEALTKPKQNPT